ncbi:uncharacterized protein KY384_005220 [Bacidia gigantensis]|uniref:uncharacterized protein n=1 Tax=Bacidia gigantensis TaxID=2732470 RepID=UPI001D048873|nr:uncharacterized protein KY384_005220 [Bacidia gigantensis]KAG8529739.1 hypothetical protein KY384_005220 [Bacidia gigantensis]
MTLGFSVGEFLKLGKETWKLYQACFNAPEVFSSAADQCFGIHAAIEQTQRYLYKLNTNYDHDHQDREIYVKLAMMTANCRRTLSRLEKILKKSKGIGASGHNVWDTTMFALRGTKEDLAEIRSELSSHMAAISLFLQSVHYQRDEGTPMKGLPGKSEEIQARPSNFQSDGHGTQSPHVPYSSASLNSALQARKKILQESFSLDQDWRNQIRLLTAAEQSSRVAMNSDATYSGEEEWLSKLPEGWQRIWLNAVEYQYRYLFRPRSHIASRAYNALVPFETFVELNLENLPPGWVEKTNKFGSKHYFQPSTGNIQLIRPTGRFEELSSGHFVGWQCHDGLPIDLNDGISRELAHARYLDERIPADDIESSLPKGWRWSCDADGHPTYTSPGTGQGSEAWQSTVHPTFLPSHSCRLPPGWDYRLDSWGTLFYVDHHTGTAQRVNPTDDGVTNTETGLPKGWTKMKDQSGADYYLEEASLIATYKGKVMKSNDDEQKIALSSNPKNGDVLPRIVDNPAGGREGWPGHRSAGDNAKSSWNVLDIFKS